MKIKYTKAPQNTEYLGHFRSCLKKGHNDSGSAEYRKFVRGDIVETTEEKPKRTPSTGVRG